MCAQSEKLKVAEEQIEQLEKLFQTESLGKKEALDEISLLYTQFETLKERLKTASQRCSFEKHTLRN